MSRFFSKKFESLVPYVPGEQPTDMKYIKLNTNESPFPPSEKVIRAAKTEAGLLHLYSDPTLKAFCNKLAELYNIKPTQIMPSNGSDEALNFAFMAFSDKDNPMVFPDITYGFYTVFADFNGIPYEVIPLKEDFSIDYKCYCGIGKNIAIANPNAPSGLVLPLWQIEEIVRSNPENIVIIDEAYIDFGGESAVPLIDKYDNLIVTQTFSKSRSMAGARLGVAIASEELIKDLNAIRYSTNPYNVNRMTMACGVAALEDNDYYMDNCKTIIKNRDYVTKALEIMGFEVIPSSTNFVFAKHKDHDGKFFYEELKKKGILVRYFSNQRTKAYIRITIGTTEQMDVLLNTINEIMEESI